MKRAFTEHFYPVGLALTAAFLFGSNAPLSKILLGETSPLFMVAFLYLGAGLGVWIVGLFPKKRTEEAPLTRREFPWAISMILLDVAAPFLLMYGLKLTTAANASLLFNFEMVATSVIAAVFFREAVGKRMWHAIGIITLASILLSVDMKDASALSFSVGSLLVMGACCCWGLENNCTRSMSEKSPSQIVILKGFGSGGTALLIALLCGDKIPTAWSTVVYAMLSGFVSYGLSIFFYVKAQRYLGAARTSAYYAAAPFAGVLLSMLILKERPTWMFGAATVLMSFGVFLTIFEKHIHMHHHEKLVHDHAHRHDDGRIMGTAMIRPFPAGIRTNTPTSRATTAIGTRRTSTTSTCTSDRRHDAPVKMRKGGR